MERIDDAIKEKVVAEAKRLAEEKAREKAGRIAEAKAKAAAEAREKARIEAERKAATERAEQKNCPRKRENWHLNEMVFNMSILWQILILRVGILSMRSI